MITNRRIDRLRFIDLFAGLGGFHTAFTSLGHECVFASEIDPTLREVYERNFGHVPHGDIRKVDASQVPDHDILCAGFPCQPFSKAGRQLGFECPESGDLFSHVARILRAKMPEFVMLENVPHLSKHADGATWEQLITTLETLGYRVVHRRLSPHEFGIPQVRDRLFIVGSRSQMTEFAWPIPDQNATPQIGELLDRSPPDARILPDNVVECLGVWQEFLDRVPSDEPMPSWPIWTMEFGADYPYDDEAPAAFTTRELCKFRGALGLALRDFSPDKRRAALPKYAQTSSPFPSWKQNFIRRNREFYARHRKWLKSWLPKVRVYPASWQKLEWNCRHDTRVIWDHLIQFRASGVRVKRATTAPSLVAMTATQVPIVGWEKRYLTPRECSRLQGLGGIATLPDSPNRAYAALGNAVNADLVALIAEKLVGAVASKLSETG